jgi:hypothetical protein
VQVPPLAAVPDLERELDDLYGLPLEEFTRARNELARRLKRAHQGDAAASVQALRKPGLVAWTANRLSRSEPGLVETLLAAGESLRETQTRALSGQAAVADVNAAAAAERAAVQELVAAARELLGPRATPALVERLSQTLRGAAIDEEARGLVQRGRLTDDVQAVGFGPLTAVAAMSVNRDEEKRKRQAALKELRAEARQRAHEAATAERAADDAEREARQLREEATSRRAAADRVAAKVAEAEA